MFRTMLKRTGKSAATPKFDRRNRHRRRLAALEGLEDRTLLSTFTVNDLGDTAGSASDVTLRYAITQANLNSGSTIGFSVTGTIELVSALPNLTADVTITGPGANLLSVNAGGHSRVFYNGPGSTSTISGLTITGGASNAGGGVFNSGTLTISDSVISGNSATAGGGVFNFGTALDNATTLTINDSVISGNSVLAGGGGIENQYSELTLIGTTVWGNRAYYGGGIENTGSRGYQIGDGNPVRLVVTNSTISGNTASGNFNGRDIGGGGIDTQDGYTFVTNSTISGNTAYHGGGIRNSSGILTVASSTLSGNTAARGGGIYGSGYQGTFVANSTLSGNSAKYGGGLSVEGFDGFDGGGSSTTLPSRAIRPPRVVASTPILVSIWKTRSSVATRGPTSVPPTYISGALTT